MGGHYLEDHPRTRKWLITMVIVSPLNGVIPLPHGLMLAYKQGLLTTYKFWDDPPSGNLLLPLPFFLGGNLISEW